MKRDLLIDSGFYLPPRAWVVEAHSEHFICGSKFETNPNVDETENRNDGSGEDFDFEF